MATASGTWLPIATTQATAYAAVKAVSDAFDSVGWALTSDTGQINITTAGGAGITIPTTASTSSFTLLGYQIRALVSSSGLPSIYCKLYYYVVADTANTASTYRLLIRTQWGTATDGVGNLSGVYGSVTGTYGAYPSAAYYFSLTVSRPFYVSSDGENYVTFLHDPGSLGRTTNLCDYMSFVAERSINPDSGAYDDSGFQAFTPATNPSSSNVAGMVYDSALGTTKSITQSLPAQLPGVWTTTAAAAGVANVFPITVSLPTVKGPMTAALACYTSDISPSTTITAEIYGVTRTYIRSACCCTPPQGAASASSNSSDGGYGALLLRYD